MSDPTTPLIDNLIQALDAHKQGLQKAGLSSADKALLCLSLLEQCYAAAEGFAEQQKQYMAQGLEDIKKK